MEFSPSNTKTTLEELQPKLTDQDLQDREDFQYLLSIMEKQGASGITQPMDYEDAISYKDKLEKFRDGKSPDGSITALFDDVIFDFDGVIYDSTYASYRAIEIMLEKKGDKSVSQPLTIEELANSYQAPFTDYYKRFNISVKTREEFASFRDAYREVLAQVNSEHHTPSTLYPEVKAVLDKLKEAKKDNPRLKVHIISAGSEDHVKKPLREAGILDDFDEVLTECHDKTTEIKNISLRSDGKGGKTVMIGDLPSDIKDAQQIDGVKTIAVARGQHERNHLGMYLPDYIVSDLNGILSLSSYSKELREKEYNKENPFISEDISREWISSVEGEEGLWRDKTLYPAMRSWVQTFNKANSVIADIGSGQGRASTELEGYGRYIGVEPSTFLTGRAKELYSSDNRDFVLGNAYEIPLGDSSVDGAISINVWFHLADLEKASQELSRVLKTGGSFFINTADNNSLEIWKSFYINPQIDEKKMQGEVKVPVNNMTLNTFYFQPNDTVISTLQKYGLQVSKVTKSLEIDGQTLFIMIEGTKL